jgi:hypothetical protein
MREHMFEEIVRPLSEYSEVKRLLAGGLSDYEVARRTRVPRATVLNWRKHHRTPPRRRRISLDTACWRPPERAAYSYLLGLYLGDGCIGEDPRRAPQLVITLDRRYATIVAEAVLAMRLTAPDVPVRTSDVPGAVRIYASHPVWLQAFPQHGPGRKHTRRIELVDWQRELTHRHPEAVIRGLIHSDGSRVINRFKTKLPSGRVAKYAYVRYFFTNYSADIRRIFCEHCELLGIRWTQSSFKNISISHRDGVAILDSFVGPKR